MLQDNIQFLKEFSKNWRTVGSITPSSKFLVRKMLRPIDFNTATHIIELGPGLGTITKEILKRIRPNCRLTVFEINEDFCDRLKNISDSRLTIIHGSAANLASACKAATVNYVVSGIPLATLPPAEKTTLLKSINLALGERGVFIQFQYSLESYRGLKNIFKKVKIDFTPFNTPPAFVYRCFKNPLLGLSA